MRVTLAVFEASIARTNLPSRPATKVAAQETLEEPVVDLVPSRQTLDRPLPVPRHVHQREPRVM